MSNTKIKAMIVMVPENFPGKRNRYACEKCPNKTVAGCKGNSFMCILANAKEAIPFEKGCILESWLDEKTRELKNTYNGAPAKLYAVKEAA